MNQALPPYTLIRSQRKTLTVQIKNAEITVRAPKTLSQNRIEQFIAEKQAWILSKQTEQTDKVAEQPCLSDNSQLLYLGRPYTVILSPNTKRLQLTENQLLLPANNQQTQKLVENWLKQQAQNHIVQRCQHWADIMQVEGLITEIRFRKTRSQWGRCSHDGRLQFNYLLMMAPTAVIDYVVIHELSHLHYMNHSPAFWRRVQQFCPDFQQQRLWLRQNGHKLFLAAKSE